MSAWVLGGSRFFQFAATLTLFGLATFRLYSAGAYPALEYSGPWPRRLFPILAGTGILSALIWLGAETKDLAGSWTALCDIVVETSFGKALVIRGAVLTLILALSCLPRPVKSMRLLLCMLSALAAASFAWTGHGAFSRVGESEIHRLADIIHLLAAGAWIGALLAFTLLAVKAKREKNSGLPSLLAIDLARFSAIGGPVIVALLVLSGLLNAWYLVGPGPRLWETLYRTAYGIVLLSKLTLFCGMLALAAKNRAILAPRLEQNLETGADTGPATLALLHSISSETALSILVVLAVATLGMLEPIYGTN